MDSNQLNCSLCLQKYKSPRILPCLHTYCKVCLEEIQHEGEDGASLICCPECVEEHPLPSNGVNGLPPNIYLQGMLDLSIKNGVFDLSFQKQHRERVSRGSLEESAMRCDICQTDDIISISHCSVCQYDMCPSCDFSHQRDTQHLTQPKIKAQSLLSSKQPDLFCYHHRVVTASHYCESCQLSLCDGCIKSTHKKHTCVKIEGSRLANSIVGFHLLRQAKSSVDDLTEAIKNLHFTVRSLHIQSAKVAAEVCESVDVQMRALQEHKRNLLQQIEIACDEKELAIHTQMCDLQKTLSGLVASYEAVSDLRVENQQVSKQPQALRSLEDCITSTSNFHPVENDYLHFFPQHPAGHCHNVPVTGRIDTVGPSGLQSTAFGSGLDCGTIDSLSQFVIKVCDCHGQVRSLGGDMVEVRVLDPNGCRVEVSMRDDKNGTYAVQFTPKVKGEHNISVSVNGQDIKRSPFVVSIVDGTSSEHWGTYHCCTFCSSSGKKNVACGCGGVMPGGYSGCGHGHPSHPGCWHWSCCGSIKKDCACVSSRK